MKTLKQLKIVASVAIAISGGAIGEQSFADETNIWDDTPVPDVRSQADSSVKNVMDQLLQDTALARQFPGVQAAVTKDGKLIYSGVFGYANWSEKTPLQSYSRIGIGSTSKVLVTMGVLKMVEQGDVSVDSKVYGNRGILSGRDYRNAYTQGVRRFHPIVDSAIGRDNQVVTWYRDGNYTIGNSKDLQQHQGARPFSLPRGQSLQTILAIAKGGEQDQVFAWYRDGSYSVGTVDDLSSISYTRGGCDSCTPFRSNRRDKIIGIAADTDTNTFYAYYHDGKVTSGDSPANLKNRWNGDSKDFSLSRDDSSRYDIVGISRSANDAMVTWFSDGKAMKGNSVNLASISEPFDYTRRTFSGSIGSWLNAYQNIEVRHLLSHTSGLTRSGQYEQARIKFGLDENESDYQYSNKYVLSTRPLLFKPGEGVSYSNHGMGLIGHIMETVSGEEWYPYLYREIFRPAGSLGIRSGGLDIVPAIDARGHNLRDNGTLSTRNYTSNTGAGSAAGSLRASAVDVARVLVATDGRRNHPDVLRQSTIDQMESHPFPGVSGHSLGWHLRCENSDDCSGKRLSHNGLVSGSAAYIVKFQNYSVSDTEVGDVTVAITVNRNSTSGLSGLANQLALAAENAGVDSRTDLFPEVTSHILPIR